MRTLADNGTQLTISAPAQEAQRHWARRLVGKAVRPVRQWAWEAGHVIRWGRPSLVVTYGDGFGDHLLCTALFRELRKRGQSGLWMMSGHPPLFEGNADIDAVVPRDWRYPVLAKRWGGRSVMPDYAQIIEAEDRSIPPKRHIISCMCERAEISGEVTLRPYMYLTPEEKSRGQLAARQIAIQSSILSASMPIRNKEWKPERFQAVVNALRHAYTFVQVGSRNDPQLEGVIDMRGKCTVRQTAAIMSQSLVFVGLVGFLMHLARAVDCRSVIVFGGREAPWQSGYSCNENIFTPLPCSPCWLWSRCDHGHRCMNEIDAARVTRAVQQQVDAAGEPLAVDVDVLPETGEFS
jgi:ADP-heptose:LPS heptosyltransferase